MEVLIIHATIVLVATLAPMVYVMTKPNNNDKK